MVTPTADVGGETKQPAQPHSHINHIHVTQPELGARDVLKALLLLLAAVLIVQADLDLPGPKEERELAFWRLCLL